MVGYIIKIENPPTFASEKTGMLIGFSVHTLFFEKKHIRLNEILTGINVEFIKIDERGKWKSESNYKPWFLIIPTFSAPAKTFIGFDSQKTN